MQQVGHDSQERSYSADYFAIGTHGFSITHLDALCHVFWQGKLYNGFDASEVGSQGAHKSAVDVASNGIISRGVLLDIPESRTLSGSNLVTGSSRRILRPPKRHTALASRRGRKVIMEILV